LLPHSSDIVLIAFLPNPKDLEIARLLGWYRIPLKSAPKLIAADWLAFYQPKSFGKENRWRIENIAPINGFELATRVDLFKEQPDHPRALEEYYKIQIGEIQTLKTPILADKLKRITFKYTTGEHLLSAETIPELTLYNDERNRVWRTLRERVKTSQFYKIDDLPELPIAAEILQMFGFLSSGNPFPKQNDTIEVVDNDKKI
jgi:hypothetical protein